MNALGPPLAIRLLRKTGSPIFHSQTFFKTLALCLTYLAYSSFHLSRRPLSVVKSVLNKDCVNDTVPDWIHVDSNSTHTWCDWEPFSGKNGNLLLGTMDTVYLMTYAIFMFFSGFIAERMDLRYFLSLGMILSGFSTYIFGLAFYYGIHNVWFFISSQVFSGIVQSTGWPAVVVIIAYWFPKSSRGTVFGLWNSHTNLGNIAGAVIAGAFVDYNWGLSFFVPGAVIAAAGFIMFLFLVPHPQEVDLPCESDTEECDKNVEQRTDEIESSSSASPIGSSCNSRDTLVNARRKSNRSRDQTDETVESDESQPLISTDDSPQIRSSTEKGAISFVAALKIPGVIEFSLSLFFSKLVSYMFLYWLPVYIKKSSNLSSEFSAYASVAFDIGGIVGSFLAGWFADRTKAPGLTCIVMLVFAIPSLFLYMWLGNINLIANVVLQALAGIMVNGPYCLITTAVSTDLGNSVKSSNAMATVSGIIDGTGSIGAAIGPYLVGLLSAWSWDSVFYIAMIADLISMFLLIRIGKKEYRKIQTNKRRNTVNA